MKEAKALKGMQVAGPDYEIDQQYVESCVERISIGASSGSRFQPVLPSK